MPKFETPEPISLTIDLGAAFIRISASDRTDTVVEVRPSDASDESDVKAAQQVRVDHAKGALQVTGPKIRAFDLSRRPRSVDVSVELPTGSRVSAETQMGDLRCAGSLGETRFKTSAGNIRVEDTGLLRVNTSTGHVTADHVAGDAEISTGTGKVRLGEVAGAVVVKNSNGDTTIDAAGGDVRVRAANGDIAVEKGAADADLKTSNGSIRVGEVIRGATVLHTAMGNLEIGIAEGTAAWLEVDTGFGHVHNQLRNATSPDDADETVEIRGRTSFGDVTIHRS